jgi:hypothetical protein
MCTSYVVYSPIWLNLFRDDGHSFNIFLWMITTLATNKDSFKKKTHVREPEGKTYKSIGHTKYSLSTLTIFQQ